MLFSGAFTAQNKRHHLSTAKYSGSLQDFCFFSWLHLRLRLLPEQADSGTQHSCPVDGTQQPQQQKQRIHAEKLPPLHAHATTQPGVEEPLPNSKALPAKPLPAISPVPVARPCGEQTAHCTEVLLQIFQRRPVRPSLLRSAVPEEQAVPGAVDEPQQRQTTPPTAANHHSMPAPRRSSLQDGCTTPPRAAAGKPQQCRPKKTLPCGLVPARGGVHQLHKKPGCQCQPHRKGVLPCKAAAVSAERMHRHALTAPSHDASAHWNAFAGCRLPALQLPH